MKNNITELVFILDRSGSMAGFEADTIGGFNATIEKQKKQEGECFVSTVLFDDVSEVLHDRVKLCDIPKMTDNGSFIINGAERVIVSQLVRSPGVYYGMTHDKTGIELYTSTINPNRGAWLEYETDANDVFYVRIDKNRKIYITAFIRALGLSSNDDIRRFFGEDNKLEATMEKDETKNTEEALIEIYKKLICDMISEMTDERFLRQIYSIIYRQKKRVGT